MTKFVRANNRRGNCVRFLCAARECVSDYSKRFFTQLGVSPMLERPELIRVVAGITLVLQEGKKIVITCKDSKALSHSLYVIVLKDDTDMDLLYKTYHRRYMIFGGTISSRPVHIFNTGKVSIEVFDILLEGEVVLPEEDHDVWAEAVSVFLRQNNDLVTALNEKGI